MTGSLAITHAAPSATPNDEDIHPDVRAYASACGMTRRRDVLYLQRQFDRGLLERIAAEEDSPVLVRNLGRRGSRNADPQGDRSARKLSKNHGE